MNAPYEEVAHTADLCLRVRGDDLEALLTHAAQGMFALMRCEADEGVRPVEARLALEAPDAETLLVDWLNELLFLSDALGQACFSEFAFDRCSETGLEAVVRGTAPHQSQRTIKAATFHDLNLAREEGDLVATITFDV